MPLAGVAFAYIPDAPWSGPQPVGRGACTWFGDSLDGTVARVFAIGGARGYGYYVNSVIDLAGTAALVAGMMPSVNRRARCVRARYFLVSAESYLATHALSPYVLRGLRTGQNCESSSPSACAVIDRPWVDVAGQHARLLDVADLGSTRLGAPEYEGVV